jgi:hypothetical protein
MNEIDVDVRAERIRAETEAITKIAEALSSLTPEGIQRVLRYINHTYQPKAASQLIFEKLASNEEEENQPKFLEFYEFFNAAGPENGSDRALVAGYWFQKILGNSTLDSFLLNKELKNLGYPASNITRDLDTLMKKKPQLVYQTRKGGTSQQARKSYKLSDEGIRAVERMIANRATANVESDSNF